MSNISVNEGIEVFFNDWGTARKRRLDGERVSEWVLMCFITRAVLLTALTIAWTSSGVAQTQEPAVPEQSTADTESAVEISKQASNPLANLWLMQVQQNNNWLGMPSNTGDRVQSNLQFQPLLSVKLTDNWNLYLRPTFQLFSSAPYQDATGKIQRATGFGDTVLAFAVSPGPELVGHWLLAAGPTFILPTATESQLGQKKWQAGPTTAVGYVGQHFITYAFAQQWFGIGGNGRKTDQMTTFYSFVYVFPTAGALEPSRILQSIGKDQEVIGCHFHLDLRLGSWSDSDTCQ